MRKRLNYTPDYWNKMEGKEKLNERGDVVVVPLGLREAERVRVNSSAERSRRSRQSAMALESRKSPKAVAYLDTREATCCTTSMVDLTELANSPVGTFKHPGCK